MRKVLIFVLFLLVGFVGIKSTVINAQDMWTEEGSYLNEDRSYIKTKTEKKEWLTNVPDGISSKDVKGILDGTLPYKIVEKNGKTTYNIFPFLVLKKTSVSKRNKWEFDYNKGWHVTELTSKVEKNRSFLLTFLVLLLPVASIFSTSVRNHFNESAKLWHLFMFHFVLIVILAVISMIGIQHSDSENLTVYGIVTCIVVYVALEVFTTKGFSLFTLLAFIAGLSFCITIIAASHRGDYCYVVQYVCFMAMTIVVSLLSALYLCVVKSFFCFVEKESNI